MNWPERPLDHTPDKTGRPDEPWLTREAIAWLERHLRPHMNVLEWGAGASTVWLAKRARYVTSIEHDPAWFDRVNAAMLEHDLAGKWQLVCRGLSRAYCDDGPVYALAGRQDVHVAIVDGRLRVFCIERAAEVLIGGGILILDNAERQEYAEAHELLADWPVIRTDNGLWRTDIWAKPPC